MPQHMNNHRHIKTLVVTALVISLSACSNSSENVSSPEGTTNPASSTSSPSPQSTESPPNVSIPGVKSVQEIKFRFIPGNTNIGYFDTVNGSTRLTNNVSKSSPIKVSGWAILPEEARLADMVIITYGDNNSVVASAPVNLNRQDIAKLLKNPVYANCGWTTTFDASTLPGDGAVLKAWAYNSERKEAIQLNSTHEVAFNQ